MPTDRTLQARDMRNNMNVTERRLWSRLKRKQMDGHKFRRQAPIGPYFADFVCLKARLVIEVDGELHEEAKDARRDAWFVSEGYRVMRFSASDVYEAVDDVTEAIYNALTDAPDNAAGSDVSRIAPTLPSPPSGEGTA